MGATYTRQSSSAIVDGGVIEASDINAEFNQVLAAFAVTSGHTHDGTAAEGGPITKLLGTAITIGDATSGTDIAVTFDGESADGVLTWMEDEDYFQFSDDLLLTTTEKLQFRDTAIYINSSADGQLDLVADTEIQIAATTIDINGAVDISGALTLAGTTLAETISDTVGAMVSSNTETNITVTYDDSDNTLDFVIGTLNQDTTGNAATATALATARTIHGVSFDGTANIDLSEVISDTVGAMVSSNTETNITVTYQDADNTLDFTIGTLNQDTTGNAATATALATARTIGGTSFDGSANIAVGLAATATALATARTIHGVSFDGTANIDLSEVISDTVGAMVSSNTETGITVTYQDADNTIDFAISSLPLSSIDIDGGTDIGAAIVDADLFIVDDGAGGTNRKATAARLKTYFTSGVSSAADDLTVGDAAVNISTSSGDITIDAAANDSDIIFKGTDATADITMLTLDGSAAGAATFNDKIIATELDISGDVDIDGTLEADAITINGTAIASVLSPIAGGTGIVTTGALDAGSITSNFGTINTGASTITTTGLISGGSLDIDNVLINGTTIGHTDDTDLLTVADGLLTVAGEISVTTLDIGGTNIASTAAELNIVDGNTSATSTTLADADRVVVNDNGTMVQVAMTDVKTYIGGGTSWQAVKTGDFTAAAGQGIFVNTTSAAITITLPAGTIGDEVSILDYAGTFDSNACTVAANGSEKIFGSTDDLTVSTERAAFTLVFTDGTQGWLFKND